MGTPEWAHQNEHSIPVPVRGRTALWNTRETAQDAKYETFSFCKHPSQLYAAECYASYALPRLPCVKTSQKRRVWLFFSLGCENSHWNLSTESGFFNFLFFFSIFVLSCGNSHVFFFFLICFLVLSQISFQISSPKMFYDSGMLWHSHNNRKYRKYGMNFFF